MTDPTTQAAVERLEKRAYATGSHYGGGTGWLYVDDVRVSDLRAVLLDRTKQAQQLAEQRGVLEWIANHRNDGLTDGSAATRTCLDEIVNLAAAAITATPPAAPSLPADDVSSLIAARCSALPGKLINCPVCGAVDKERDRQEADVVALVKATEKLNGAVDAMWNDKGRVHMPGGFIKSGLVAPITEAQRDLKAALAPFADRVAGEGQ